ncbi:myb-like protein X [Thunnus albacares]|uniref:myb-like protein X n=1 Tax=Thunnus albacares TaxID=8236 RepID=UPI001CF68839|nr:myb-like protein X [Thunnus albacares]
MSFAEDDLTDGSLTEPSQEDEQKESEIYENSSTNEFDPKDPTDEDVKSKDLLNVNQKQRRTISPLTLFKEDLNHFKEELLNVFKDKDTKTTHEDRSSSQRENKPAASTLHLLKEDLSQFKEDVTSVFNKDKDMKSADAKTSQLINPLSLLKEDFSHFRDDISSIFRISLSKERDKKDDDSSNAVKIKDSIAERSECSDKPFTNLFRKDQSKVFKTVRRPENVQEDKKMVSEKSEEQMDGGFRGNLSEPNAETVDAKKMNNNKRDGRNQLEESELDVNISEDETESFSEIQKSEEILTAEQKCWTEDRSDDSSQVSGEDEKMDKEKEEDKSSPSSGISLFCLRDTNKVDRSDQPDGDLWLLKDHACYLTFDPNTANSELRLSDGNRKATRVWSDHRPSDHPDRFKSCPQLLCREGLLDSAYWEVVWSGGADIGVTYNSIYRDGDAASCLLGCNDLSWSLECSEGSYTPSYNNKRLRSCSPEPFTHRVGVYLDWGAGSLSFYCVSRDAMIHLHTFTSTFTEPLYPGFWVWAYNGSVSLCQVELDWERLLQ